LRVRAPLPITPAALRAQPRGGHKLVTDYEGALPPGGWPNCPGKPRRRTRRAAKARKRAAMLLLMRARRQCITAQPLQSGIPHEA
jgi:hypothetical protein